MLRPILTKNMIQVSLFLHVSKTTYDHIHCNLSSNNDERLDRWWHEEQYEEQKHAKLNDFTKCIAYLISIKYGNENKNIEIYYCNDLFLMFPISLWDIHYTYITLGFFHRHTE